MRAFALCILLLFLLAACRGGHVTQQATDGFVQRDIGAKADNSPSAPQPAFTGGVIAAGRFTADTHRTQGSAVLLATANGTTLLFNSFGVEARPGLAVYLAPALNPKEGVMLGPLQSSVGDQSYAVPLNLNPAYRTVLIYSPGTSSLFGHATLSS